MLELNQQINLKMNNCKITQNSIRWVVALKEEAQVILDHYKLKSVDEKRYFEGVL